MRTTRDRIRHAVGFELIGLALVTPLGMIAFGKPLHEIGAIAVIGATLAMLWTYIYNIGFDHLMQRLTGGTQKTLPQRIAHAVLFELGLLLVLLPVIAWWLGITLWEALVMDAAFALFYMVYALVYNWAYDRLFPLPEWRNARG
ncbi:PACE efflux transporter [Cereibacter changlensis]|uniref:PACE efflux transporter n=1 Tax=Cereibacter changlensis TaxID=402884 RepID=A0A4U0YWK6_9RHOB|nr:PACE efflux transporter [Cereibacter changlensis]TKA96128.1 PACE efflux transporter [Cereibacter changlensis]